MNGLWPVALRDDLRHALVAEDMRKIDRWTARHGVAHASWLAEPLDPFFNANTPQDIAAAEQLARLGDGLALEEAGCLSACPGCADEKQQQGNTPMNIVISGIVVAIALGVVSAFALRGSQEPAYEAYLDLEHAGRRPRLQPRRQELERRAEASAQ